MRELFKKITVEHCKLFVYILILFSLLDIKAELADIDRSIYSIKRSIDYIDSTLSNMKLF